MNTGQLLFTIQTVHRIKCECCDDSLELLAHTFTKLDASTSMYIMGWRFIDKIVHCPACVPPNKGINAELTTPAQSDESEPTS